MRLARLTTDTVGRVAKLGARHSLALRTGARAALPDEWRAAALAAISMLAGPITVVALVDVAVGHGDVGAMWTLSAALVLFTVSDAACRWRALRVRASAEDGLEARAQTLTESALRLSSDGTPADRLSQLTAVRARIIHERGPLRHAALELPGLFAAALALALLGGPAALAPVAAIAGLALFAGGAAKGLGAQSAALRAADVECDNFVAECAANLAVVRSAALGPALGRRLDLLQARRRARADAAHEDRSADLEPLLVAGAALATAAVLSMLGASSVGVIFGCALLAMRAAPIIVSVGDALRESQRLSAPEPAPSVLTMNADGARPQAPVIRVDAEATGAGDALDVPFGAMVALKADDGRRAARLLRIIAGLETPACGEALINGRPAAEQRTAGAIVLVTPRAPLFAGSILDNLTMFGAASRNAALAACDLLALRSEIERLPRGLSTIVGDGAADLSPSLEHRIALARAFALRPEILLLEEPQALLDKQADARLMHALQTLKGACTIIMASSRPSYAALADLKLDFDAPAPRAGALVP